MTSGIPEPSDMGAIVRERMLAITARPKFQAVKPTNARNKFSEPLQMQMS